MPWIGDACWALAVAFAAHRIAQAIMAFAPSGASSERKMVATEDIPEDLMALAAAESAAWAQEDLIRVIRERYDDLKDWNRVRAAMGVGRMT